MQEFLLYPLIIFIIFLVIFVILSWLDIWNIILGESKLGESSLNEFFVLSLVAINLFIYFSDTYIFQKYYDNIGIFFLYGFLFTLFILPIIISVIVASEHFSYFIVIYLSVVFLVYAVNIKFDNKKIKNEFDYKITKKDRKSYSNPRNSGGYTNSIQFCRDKNQECLTRIIKYEEYKDIKINQTIKVIKYNGYFGVCWWEIDLLNKKE